MHAQTRQAILDLYDGPDPSSPGRTILGYDRDHAERTARIVQLVTRELSLSPAWQEALEATTLLHDVGRLGMDPQLFGRIFGLAQEMGLPLRPRELRERYPDVSSAQATSFFLDLIEPELRRRGIPIDERLVDHIRMRMDFKGRLREVLKDKKARLTELGVTIHPWMEKVMLYYYYPEHVAQEPDPVKLMAMALVACENFEAFNNRQRGRDYYGRPKERLRDVFTALARFEASGLVSSEVMAALRGLTASGKLDPIIRESRGMPTGEPLPEDDLRFVEEVRAVQPI